MMAAIIFLRLNGIEPTRDSDEWERLGRLSSRRNFTVRAELLKSA
jgi:hypothetical protein